MCAAFYSRDHSTVGGQRSLDSFIWFQKHGIIDGTVFLPSVLVVELFYCLGGVWCTMMKLDFASCRNGLSDCKLPSLFAITNFTFDCNEFFHETAELISGRISRRDELVKRRRKMRWASRWNRGPGERHSARLFYWQNKVILPVSCLQQADNSIACSRGKVWLSKRFPFVSKQNIMKLRLWAMFIVPSRPRRETMEISPADNNPERPSRRIGP